MTDAPVTKETPVQALFNGASVLVTGGSGFVGKVLTEKLLRATQVSTIYLLLRPKKGKNVETRLEEIFNDPLFEPLAEIAPKFRHRLRAIPGDCSLPGLALSPADRQRLIQDVSVVFHGAATVRFDEKLKLATAINAGATRELLELAREMKSLKAFVHVSTVYCNCHQPEIKEQFYEPPMQYQKLFNIVDSVSDRVLESITPIILDKWPNTYTFTKALAEDVVKEEGVGLPVAVFRPAIVVGTRSEPVKGWIDNVYGPTGVLIGAGTGLLRTLHADGRKNANIVPVDLLINALVASAWDIAEKKTTCAEDIPIYNYESTTQNPITWTEVTQQALKQGMTVPTVRAMWYLSFRMTQYRALHQLYVWLLHFLPAIIVDSAAVCVGKKPKLLGIYKKINRFCEVLSYFTTRSWKTPNDNVQALWKKLSPEDQKLFFFDISQLRWEQYFHDYIRGCRKYILHDELSTVPEATKRWRRLYWLHQGVKSIICLAILRLVWYFYTW